MHMLKYRINSSKLTILYPILPGVGIIFLELRSKSNISQYISVRIVSHRQIKAKKVT